MWICFTKLVLYGKQSKLAAIYYKTCSLCPTNDTACEIEAASVYYKRRINIWLRNGPNNEIMLTQFSPNNETNQ